MVRRILVRLVGHVPAMLDQHGREDQAPTIDLGWRSCLASASQASTGPLAVTRLPKARCPQSQSAVVADVFGGSWSSPRTTVLS